MADTHFPDEWLANSLGEVLPPDRLVELRGKAAPGATLWECVVAEKLATDEQILTALSTRFRLKLADVRLIEPSVKEKVPEQLARRFHVLPLRVTDSYLEVATANPCDLDAEKALARRGERERLLGVEIERVGRLGRAGAARRPAGAGGDRDLRGRSEPAAGGAARGPDHLRGDPGAAERQPR